MKKYWDGVGLALTCLTMSLLSVHATEPTVSPSGDQVLPYEEGGSFSLSVTAGECPEPSDDAECPPWTKDGNPTFEWNPGGVSVKGGTSGETLEIDTSKTGTGSITVTQTQKWKDDQGTQGPETTITTSAAQVTVVKVLDVVLDQQALCDGKDAKITLTIEPTSAEPDLTVTIDMTSLSGGSTAGNPAGDGSQAAKGQKNTDWEVRHARWFSTQSNHCNNQSTYKIDVSARVPGGELTVNPSSPLQLTVKADRNCVNGVASVRKRYHSGNISVDTSDDSNGNWVADIGLGNIARDVKGTATNSTNPNSQYFNMVQREEDFHVGQLEGTTSQIFADLFSPFIAFAQAEAQEPFYGNTQTDAINNAELAFDDAIKLELTRSISYVTVLRRCEAEIEAKNAANATYKLTIPCTYSYCN